MKSLFEGKAEEGRRLKAADVLLNGLLKVTHSALTGIDVPRAVVKGVISCVVGRIDASACFGLCKESSRRVQGLAIDDFTLSTGRDVSKFFPHLVICVGHVYRGYTQVMDKGGIVTSCSGQVAHAV